MFRNEFEGNYSNATNSYQAAVNRVATPSEIILILYRTIHLNLEKAKNAYINKDLGKMCLINANTFEIISMLRAHITYDCDNDFPNKLNNFYLSLTNAIANILQAANVVEEYNRIDKTVEEMYHFWRKISVIASHQNL